MALRLKKDGADHWRVVGADVLIARRYRSRAVGHGPRCREAVFTAVDSAGVIATACSLASLKRRLERR